MAILEPSNPSILSSTKLPSASTIDGKYDFAELDEVSLAYAVTIHKSQGSEFPAAVIPITTQHYVLLQRNLIYTGLSRQQRGPFHFAVFRDQTGCVKRHRDDGRADRGGIAGEDAVETGES